MENNNVRTSKQGDNFIAEYKGIIGVSPISYAHALEQAKGTALKAKNSTKK